MSIWLNERRRRDPGEVDHIEGTGGEPARFGDEMGAAFACSGEEEGK